MMLHNGFSFYQSCFNLNHLFVLLILRFLAKWILMFTVVMCDSTLFSILLAPTVYCKEKYPREAERNCSATSRKRGAA
jgi:hypothetical protein